MKESHTILRFRLDPCDDDSIRLLVVIEYMGLFWWRQQFNLDTIDTYNAEPQCSFMECVNDHHKFINKEQDAL